MKNWTDKANGYGVWFRFITPVLITIALFILGLIVADLREMKMLFSNHLEHHRNIEIKIAERLSSIETILKRQ